MQAFALGAGQALPLLAALYRASGDDARLAAVLLEQAGRTSGAERAALLREAVSHLSADQGADLDEQILEIDPSDEAARDRLLARLRATGDAAALIARLEREIPQLSAEHQATYARELGRLAARSGDDARAAAAWTTALAALPSLEAASALWELLTRAGRRAEAAPLFEAALADPRLDIDERGELLRLAGEAYLAPGADAARALAFFERARAAGEPLPLDQAAFRPLLRAERRFLDLVVALDAAATEAPNPAERLGLELEAAETLERELGRPGDAARRYAALFDQQPERRDLAKRARTALRGRGRADLRAGAARQGAARWRRRAEASDRAQLKIVRGELLLQAGADAEAEAEFLHALITTPRVGRAHAALAEVYKRRGDLAGALEHLIAAADAPDLEPTRAAACAVDAADVLLDEGDATTAERLYQLAAALDPADRRAVDGAGAAGGGARRSRAPRRSARARRRAHRRSARAGAAGVAARAAVPDRAQARPRRLSRLQGGGRLRSARCARRRAALREMAETRGEWALAAEQLYRELALTSDAAERARAARRARAAARGQAARHRRRRCATTSRPPSWPRRRAERRAERPRVPWADLLRLYAEAQRWRDAALAAERLAATLTGGTRALGSAPRRCQRAGELYERAGDHERGRASGSPKRRPSAAKRAARPTTALLRLAEDERRSERAAPPHRGAAGHRARGRAAPRAAASPAGAGRAHSAIWPRSTRARRRSWRAPPDDAEAFVAAQAASSTRAATGRRWRSCCARAPPPSTTRPSAPSAASRRAASSRAALRRRRRRRRLRGGARRRSRARGGARRARRSLLSHAAPVARARALYAQLADRPSSLGSDEVWRRRGRAGRGGRRPRRGAHRLRPGGRAQNSSNLAAHQALARLALGARRRAAGLPGAARGPRSPAARRRRSHHRAAPPASASWRSSSAIARRRATTSSWCLSQLPMRDATRSSCWRASTSSSSRGRRRPRRSGACRTWCASRPSAPSCSTAAARCCGSASAISSAPTTPTSRRPICTRRTRRRCAAWSPTTTARATSARSRRSRAISRRSAQPLDEAAIEAGLGLALGGDEARGTVVVAVAQADGGAARRAAWRRPG